MFGSQIQSAEGQVAFHLPTGEAGACTSGPSTQGLSVNPAVESVAQSQLSQGTTSNSSPPPAPNQKPTEILPNLKWDKVPLSIFELLSNKETLVFSTTSKIVNSMFYRFKRTSKKASFATPKMSDERLRNVVTYCPQLRVLKLFGFNGGSEGISDQGLQVLTTLNNLQTLVLRGSNYHGEFAFLTHLKLLDLSLSKITTSNIDFLSALSTLRSLDLHSISIFAKDSPGENLRERHLTRLAALTQLEDLTLEEIRNTTFLSTLTNLHSFTLNNSFMTDDGLMSLSAFKKLEILTLNWTFSKSDRGLIYLTVLSKLHTLRLLGSNITGTGLSHLTALSGLHTLNVSYSKITAPGFISLAALTSLTKLEMESAIKNEHDLASLKPLTKLKLLNLSHTCITGVGLQNLASFTELEELNLNGCIDIADGALHCFTSLPALAKLDLRFTAVTISGLDEFKRKGLLKGVQVLMENRSLIPIVWQW